MQNSISEQQAREMELTRENEKNMRAIKRSVTKQTWTDAAIEALQSDAFRVHPTIWNELRRVEKDAARYNKLLKMVGPLSITVGPTPETLMEWIKNPDAYRAAISSALDALPGQP